MRTKLVCELNRGNKNVRIHMDNQLKSHLSSISIFILLENGHQFDYSHS